MPMTAETSPSDRRKWGGDQPLAAEARQRLIDAGLDLLTSDGLDAFTIGAIASAAGVTRPTVYSYFEDRDELLREALAFAVRTAMARAIHKVSSLARPRALPVELVAAGVNECRAHHALGRMLLPGNVDPVAASICAQSIDQSEVTQALTPVAERLNWDERKTFEAAELISRLIASFLVAPNPRRSDAELRRFLERRLNPALGVHLSDPSS